MESSIYLQIGTRIALDTTTPQRPAPRESPDSRKVLGLCSMTEVENKLMMILMRLALLDSASSEPSRPSVRTRQEATEIATMSVSDTPPTHGPKANHTKPA